MAKRDYQTAYQALVQQICTSYNEVFELQHSLKKEIHTLKAAQQAAKAKDVSQKASENDEYESLYNQAYAGISELILELDQLSGIFSRSINFGRMIMGELEKKESEIEP